MVFDEKTASPLLGATVVLSSESTSFNRGILSGADGSFRFYGVAPSDDYVLQVRKVGYETYTRQQTVVRVGDWLILPPVLLKRVAAPAPSAPPPPPLPSPASSQRAPKPPLSKADVIYLLKGDVSPKRVGEIARERGIDFEVTPTVRSELRRAGATGELLAALRGLAPKPPAAPPVLEIQSTPGHAQDYVGDALAPLSPASGENSRDDAGTGRGPYRAGDGVSMPVSIYSPEPGYSDEARAAKVQGTVILRVVVGADGSVSSVRVEKPVGHGLDEKAVETVRTWKFRPCMRNGAPVACEVSIEFTFRLF